MSIEASRLMALRSAILEQNSALQRAAGIGAGQDPNQAGGANGAAGFGDAMRSALARVGMSYRHGWGYFRELERASGIRFLEPAGGGPRGGMRLTSQGREFLARYRRFRAGLDEVAARQFRRSFAPRRRR